MHRAGKLRRTGVRSLLAALPGIALACASEQPQVAPASAYDAALPGPTGFQARKHRVKLKNSDSYDAHARWTYNAGGPLASSARIASDDAVLIATLDGNVHALRADGSFRWSFSLKGAALGRPLQTPEGHVYAATSSTLWALDADGGLRWSSVVPGGVTSAPVLDTRGRVWLTTGGGTLLGYGRNGGVSGFAKVGPTPAWGPVALERGEVAVVSADGALRVTAPFSAVERGSAAVPLRELRASRDAVLALGPNGLARFEGARPVQRWERPGVSRIACTRPSVVVLEGSTLTRLSDAGEPTLSVPWNAPVNGPIACLADGTVVGLTAEGRLFRPLSEDFRTFAVPRGDVLGLETNTLGQVIVVYRDGRVLGLEPLG